MSSRSKPAASKRRKTRPTPKPPPVQAHSPLGPVDPQTVELVRVAGTLNRGGGPGGEAWRIDVAGKRAGLVFVNRVDEPPLGRHASIQIFLNRASQGRRIGRLGYEKACELSQYDEIFAHMRKSNIASRRAAEEAGFKNVTPAGHSQMIYKRVRAKRAM